MERKKRKDHNYLFVLKTYPNTVQIPVQDLRSDPNHAELHIATGRDTVAFVSVYEKSNPIPYSLTYILLRILQMLAFQVVGN